MQVEWWYWLVAGVLLMLAELLVPAFFIFWFGMSAVLVGVVLALAPGLSFPVQLLLWALASVVMVVTWFRLFRRKGDVGPERWTAEEWVGEPGQLIEPVSPFTRGKVRFTKPILGYDEWTCLADEDIAVGQAVRLVSFQGDMVKVARA